MKRLLTWVGSLSALVTLVTAAGEIFHLRQPQPANLTFNAPQGVPLVGIGFLLIGASVVVLLGSLRMLGRLRREAVVAMPYGLRSFVPDPNRRRFWKAKITVPCPTCPDGFDSDADVRLMSFHDHEGSGRKWLVQRVCRRNPKEHRGRFDTTGISYSGTGTR